MAAIWRGNGGEAAKPERISEKGGINVGGSNWHLKALPHLKLVKHQGKRKNRKWLGGENLSAKWHISEAMAAASGRGGIVAKPENGMGKAASESVAARRRRNKAAGARRRKKSAAKAAAISEISVTQQKQRRLSAAWQSAKISNEISGGVAESARRKHGSNQ